MMLSKVEAGKKKGGVSSEQKKLLKDVDTMSKALYLDRSSSRNSISTANSRSKSQLPDPKSRVHASTSVDNNNLQKDKKSIWNWRPLKALSHIRNKRFNCSFYVQVHLIEGLPSTLDNANLSVYWKRRDGVLVTRPVKVVEGNAEFEEKLTFTCSVYGSRSGPHHSAKYEAKHFLLYASLVSSPEVDLGKHRVDLTRLLPLTLEELEEEKSSGKWTTSFRLSGIAKGAVMNVSFGYTVVGENSGVGRESHNAMNVLSTSRQGSLASMKSDVKLKQLEGSGSMRRTGSLRTFTSPYSSQTVDEVKDLHEVLPVSKSVLASSLNMLYKKFDEDEAVISLQDEPELDVFTENLELAKSDAYALSDHGKNMLEDYGGKDGNTCLVHDKTELDVSDQNLKAPNSGKENLEECQGNDFVVVDKGIELSSNESVRQEESMVKAPEDAPAVDSTCTLDTTGIKVSCEESVKHNSLDEVNDSSKDQEAVHELACKEDDFYSKELLLQELELAINSVSDLETATLESPKFMEAESKYKMGKSHSLDDVTDSVANEFLSMLGIDQSPIGLSSESEPESPRELLLREFEKEALDGGFSLFDFGMDFDNEADGSDDACTGSEQCNNSEGMESSSLLQNVHGEEHLVESQDVRSKQRAQMLEDLETEALMQEWGLNEKAFHHSPPKDCAGVGSPVHFPPEDPPTLPPLADGLGPFLQTKDGGFLRSMNPSLFQNAKSGGSLVMQVSNPVVVPAEMGSGIMEVLQSLASVGIEKLSMQAKELMPLEDITGKTMQQIAWEAMPVLEGTERECHMQHDFMITGPDSSYMQSELKGKPSGVKSNKKISSGFGDNQTGSEFVSLEDLAPLAMDKIEALSMEGLRIQSGMSEEDAPSNIIAQSIGDLSALQGKGIDASGSLGLEGAAGLQLLDTKGSGNGVDGIMGLSLTLDEWMKLDSGEIEDIDNINEHTCKLLAAHHANSFDFIRGSSKGERKRGKARKCGLLGNNFTVSLMVQLRDPLRNYEPVGTPMLALIQVERVFVPPKPRIFSTVSEIRNNNNDEDDEREIVAKVEIKDNNKKEEKISEEGAIPQFKITEVHVAGMKSEPHKKKLWGSSSQQQSGSRWLVANGMGKNNKAPFMKSKKAPSKTSAPVTTKVQPGDTLWSISSRIFGTLEKWKDLAPLNPHVRNPNVIIPSDTIRLS